MNDNINRLLITKSDRITLHLDTEDREQANLITKPD